MKRKLLVLDLVLMAAIGAATWRVRQDWLAARARENKHTGQAALRPAPPPPVVNMGSPPQSVTAAGYADIAEKMLFSRDRNPTVIVEPPPAPPVKPMPALPVLYGVMNLVDGTTVIMGERMGAKHQGIRLGQKVGEFTLVAVNREEITLEWDGKSIKKKIEEMIDRGVTPVAPPEGNMQRPAPTVPGPVVQAKPKAEAAPGIEIGKGVKACQPGDASPAGTASGGYRKIVTPTPFGNSCRWEPI